MAKEIQITKGKIAIVDDEDYEKLSQKKWYYAGGYARSKKISMHRYIMQPPDNMVVDHIDGNGLNNCRSNLRVCTTIENSWNRRLRKDKDALSSMYKGVRVSDGKFEVKVLCSGEYHHIGIFTNEIAAANAYNYWAKHYFGEFAHLNDCPLMGKGEWEKYKITKTSLYRGVSWNEKRGKWNVDIYIKEKGKTKYAGLYDLEVDAAIVYNQEMYKLYGNDFSANYLEGINDYNGIKINKYKESTYSKYHGVTFYKRYGKWAAKVYINGKSKSAGNFDTEMEAVLAYNKLAFELLGDKAKLNKLEGDISGRSETDNLQLV